MSENTITLREQTTALITAARMSDDPGPVLDLLGTYVAEQPTNAARADLSLALVVALAHQCGQAFNTIDALLARQQDDES